MNAYGYSRQTGDLDLVIKKSLLQKWKELITTLGYKCFHEQHAFAQFSPPEIGYWPIDLMLVDDATFEKLLSTAVSEDFDGDVCLIPSIINLIAMKLHALKSGQKDRELKDLDDTVKLVRLGNIDVRNKDFKALCMKFANEAIYERIKEYV